jgi:hypothetical protein
MINAPNGHLSFIGARRGFYEITGGWSRSVLVGLNHQVCQALVDRVDDHVCTAAGVTVRTLHFSFYGDFVQETIIGLNTALGE